MEKLARDLVEDELEREERGNWISDVNVEDLKELKTCDRDFDKKDLWWRESVWLEKNKKRRRK